MTLNDHCEELHRLMTGETSNGRGFTMQVGAEVTAAHEVGLTFDQFRRFLARRTEITSVAAVLVGPRLSLEAIERILEARRTGAVYPKDVLSTAFSPDEIHQRFPGVDFEQIADDAQGLEEARSSRSPPAASRSLGASAPSAAIPEVITLNLGLIVENLSADETRTIVAKRSGTANSEARPMSLTDECRVPSAVLSEGFDTSSKRTSRSTTCSATLSAAFRPRSRLRPSSTMPRMTPIPTGCLPCVSRFGRLLW